MKPSISTPSCSGCPNDLHFQQFSSCKQYGVTMHFGERFCIGGKKARRFKKSDPKVTVPSWCPKRISPTQLYLYTFKSEQDRAMFAIFHDAFAPNLQPDSFRYALSQKTTTQRTVKEFWAGCQVGEDQLEIDVPLYGVIGLDDGLQVQYFFKTEMGYIYVPYFNAPKEGTSTRKQEEPI